jgi:hypothetical protein
MRTLYFWLMVLAVVDVVFSFPFLFTASPLAVNAFTSGVVVFLAANIAESHRHSHAKRSPSLKSSGLFKSNRT